jgi:hypothetical protein
MEELREHPESQVRTAKLGPRAFTAQDEQSCDTFRLVTLDDEDGFVVDFVLFATAAKAVVAGNRVIEQGVANVFRGLAVAIAHDQFELLAFWFVAAVVNTIGIEEEDVAGAHQGEFGNIRGFCGLFAGFHGQIAIAIGVIFGDLQAQREELDHAAAIDVHEFAEFGGEDQRRGMTKVDESKIPVWPDFAIEHGGNFLGALFFTPAEGVASGDGIGQAEIDALEQFGGSFAAVIEFGKHEGVEGVVNGGGDFGGDDAVALRVDQEDAGSVVEFAEIFSNAHLLGAAGAAILGFHFRLKSGTGFEPGDMIVDGIARRGAGRKRFEVFAGFFESTLDASVDVVALLKVYVFEEIAADGARGNGVAIHFDSLNVRNRAFHGHKPLTEIFIDAGTTVGFRHRRILSRENGIGVELWRDTVD